MRGLIAKTLRETWLTTAFLAGGLFLVTLLLTFVLPRFQDQVGGLLAQLPVVKTFLSALLGIDVEAELTAQLIQSLVWVHPVVLAILWTHAIIFCTRMPAGEIHGGTIDFLLGLPVSRWQVYLSEGLLCLMSGLLVVSLGALGHVAGVQISSGAIQPAASGVVFAALNEYGLYLAVAGLAGLFTSMSDRRGRAAAVVVTVVLASFLLNFLAQFWEPAGRVGFLGLLEYYRPAEILRDGSFPVRDIAVLLSISVLSWAVGGFVLIRRSICTV